MFIRGYSILHCTAPANRQRYSIYDMPMHDDSMHAPPPPSLTQSDYKWLYRRGPLAVLDQHKLLRHSQKETRYTRHTDRLLTLHEDFTTHCFPLSSTSHYFRLFISVLYCNTLVFQQDVYRFGSRDRTERKSTGLSTRETITDHHPTITFV